MHTLGVWGDACYYIRMAFLITETLLYVTCVMAPLYTIPNVQQCISHGSGLSHCAKCKQSR